MDLSKSYDVFQPEKYRNTRINVIGCGSIGATVAMMLTRYGLTKFGLWDFDKVEAHNLGNQIFRQKDIGTMKIDALLDILTEINPDITRDTKLHYEGWNGNSLSGVVILAVDNIETRRAIVTSIMENGSVRAVFDFRTGLYDAQAFAADWADRKQRENILNTMNFTHEEAVEATPVSACNITLSVCPTVYAICALGCSNITKFLKGDGIQKMTIIDTDKFYLESYPA